MNDNELFYPPLVRQTKYPQNPQGEYFDYKRYRPHIRKDCQGRCIYCDTHENENGGHEHMNLDHFRPKSIPRFTHLINNPLNLIWTCGGCNRLKSNHWPDKNSDESIVGNIGFVDPFVSPYKDFFDIQDNGELTSKKIPAEYMLKLLALNRQSKRRIRELRLKKYQIINQFSEQISKIKVLAQQITDPEQQRILEEHSLWLLESQQTIVKLLDFNLH